MKRVTRMLRLLVPEEPTAEERIELHEARIGSLESRVDELERPKESPHADGTERRDGH